MSREMADLKPSQSSILCKLKRTGWKSHSQLDFEREFCNHGRCEFKQPANCQQFRRLVLLYQRGDLGHAAALTATITSLAAGAACGFFVFLQVA